MEKLQKRKTGLPAAQPEIQEETELAVATNTEENGGNPVARRAYQLWLERGCPDGSPEEDWYRAEHELGIAGKPVEQASRAAGPSETSAQTVRSAR